MGRTGRTFRNRYTKKTDNSQKLNNDLNYINLKKWLHLNGWSGDPDICVALFDKTGRGVMCNKYERNMPKLISLPFHLLITLITLENDNQFKDIFRRHKHLFHKFKFHDLLSIFLLWHKHLGEKSVWFHYIKTIPEYFTVPYFCSESEINEFPKSINDIIKIQKQNIKDKVELIECLFSGINCPCCKVSMCVICNKEKYEWAYFAVNTRCVYIDPISIRRMNNTNFFNYFMLDEPSLGLAPLLDLFNHSNDTKTYAELTLSAEQIDNSDILIPKLKFLSETTETKVRAYQKEYLSYELHSFNSTKKYKQSFINYGAHCNLKLVIEYGFWIPNNEHHFIKFDIKDVLHIIQENYKELHISYCKYSYVKQKFKDKLFINADGLSYHLVALLKLIFIIDDAHKNYSACFHITSDIENIKIPTMTLLELILKEKKKYIEKLLSLQIQTDCLAIVIGYLEDNVKLISNVKDNIHNKQLI